MLNLLPLHRFTLYALHQKFNSSEITVKGKADSHVDDGIRNLFTCRKTAAQPSLNRLREARATVP